MLFLFLVESFNLPYWHNRGLALIATRYGAGFVDLGNGNPIFVFFYVYILKLTFEIATQVIMHFIFYLAPKNPDNDFDFMMLVKNEVHWKQITKQFVEKCPKEFLCVKQLLRNKPRYFT